MKVKRNLWKVVSMVGGVVLLLVSLTYLIGTLTQKEPESQTPMKPPEVSISEGLPQWKPSPGGIGRVRSPTPSLPPQRPPFPLQPNLRKGAERKTEVAEKPGGEVPAEESKPSEEGMRSIPPTTPPSPLALPEPKPYKLGMDARKYIFDYLCQVREMSKAPFKWVPDWVEIDVRRNFVTVFSHVEGERDREAIIRAARDCLRLVAASVGKVYPPAYWLSVRIRLGYPQGALILVADFDRLGMVQALQGEGIPVESLAKSVWWNPYIVSRAE